MVLYNIEVGKTSMLKKFLRTDLEAKDDIIRKHLFVKTCNYDDMWYHGVFYIGSTVTPDDIGYRVFKYRDKHVKLKLWDMPGICSCFNVVNERYIIII